jgi:lincosamide nucleotidyltransferase B/F
VLIQQRLIDKVREACRADERLDAALMYGSFASGEADAHSDVEFWLFFLPQWQGQVDARQWCDQLGPVNHLVHNEFGTDVAFFAGLVRGEFHFATTDDIPTVRTWPVRGAATDQMIVLDRSGLLRPALDSLADRPPVPGTAEDIEALCGRFANWLVLTHHVAARGELLRAGDALGHAHRHLLWIARLAEGSTEHWLTPSRRAETDLPSDVVAELCRSTAAAEPDELRDALRKAWRLGRRYWIALARQYHRTVPDALFAELDHTL